MSLRLLPDLRNVSRVLIIRLGAIGDVVHALPVASALKDAFPHLEITWLVEEIPADMVTGNPDLHDVIVIPRSRWKRGRATSPQIWREYIAFLSGIRVRRFDVTIDLQGYAKTALMVMAAGAPHRVGWWRLRDGANLVSVAIPQNPGSVHRIDWYLDVARALGVENTEVRFPIFIPPSARDMVREALVGANIDPARGYIVINQAAGNPPRRWGRERFGELAARIALDYRLPSVLIGTKPEFQDCEAIRAQVKRRLESAAITDVPLPLNLAGMTTLKELAALLERCCLHVSGDTGSTHIAAALGTPLLAFYGSTDPAHAGPWGQMDHVLARRELCGSACTVRQCAFNVAPCQQEASAGSEKCPAETRSARCLGAISVEEAMAKVASVIKRAC